MNQTRLIFPPYSLLLIFSYTLYFLPLIIVDLPIQNLIYLVFMVLFTLFSWTFCHLLIYTVYGKSTTTTSPMGWRRMDQLGGRNSCFYEYDDSKCIEGSIQSGINGMESEPWDDDANDTRALVHLIRLDSRINSKRFEDPWSIGCLDNTLGFCVQRGHPADRSSEFISDELRRINHWMFWSTGMKKERFPGDRLKNEFTRILGRHFYIPDVTMTSTKQNLWLYQTTDEHFDGSIGCGLDQADDVRINWEAEKKPRLVTKDQFEGTFATRIFKRLIDDSWWITQLGSKRDSGCSSGNHKSKQGSLDNADDQDIDGRKWLLWNTFLDWKSIKEAVLASLIACWMHRKAAIAEQRKPALGLSGISPVCLHCFYSVFAKKKQMENKKYGH
ncbi:hypothetical protein CAEBREN_15106 [Caenorhabditis brenneri]|uniref:Uncharacterized protein n=1 Tax=Caenorhabditis brenneri TaxID=135651 RepID=G0N716_CAEBE|nr:hypothetical protein CAEBREN_15106 [Caenorhabditis brenneri]